MASARPRMFGSRFLRIYLPINKLTRREEPHGVDHLLGRRMHGQVGHHGGFAAYISLLHVANRQQPNSGAYAPNCPRAAASTCLCLSRFMALACTAKAKAKDCMLSFVAAMRRVKPDAPTNTQVPVAHYSPPPTASQHRWRNNGCRPR